MVKRIPCKVIRSVVLDQSDNVLGYAKVLANNIHSAACDASANIGSEYTTNSFSYPEKPNAGFAGQIIDFYA